MANGDFIHEGFRIRPRGKAWQVDFGVDDAGKHTRKSFKTRGEAMACAEDEARDRLRVSMGGRKLSMEQREQAAKAMELLEGRCSLLEAARFWVGAHPVNKGVSVEELCRRFLIWMEVTPRKLRSRAPGGYRDESMRDAERKLRGFRGDLGHVDAASFSREMFLKWVEGIAGSDVHKDNVRRVVAMAFSWACSEGPLKGGVNVLAGMRPLCGPPGVPVVWSPEEVAGFMGALECCQGAFALMFFAGLRPEEVLRLDPGDVGSEILIRAEVSKTGRPRVVSIVDNCGAWLEKYPFVGVKRDAVRKAREAACVRLGVEWVADVPRHCFATYGAALWGMDRAADELGHLSTAMLHRHYRGLVRNRRKAGEAYFGIRPEGD